MQVCGEVGKADGLDPFISPASVIFSRPVLLEFFLGCCSLFFFDFEAL